jgi:cell division septal protein FtsQ
MNRRRTVERHPLRRLIQWGKANRRVRPSASQSVVQREPLPGRFGRFIRRGAVYSLWALAGIAGLSVVSYGGYFVYREVSTSTYFDLKTIRIRGLRSELSAQVEATLAPFRDRLSLSLDLAAVRRRVLAQPWIKQATVERVLPSTLEIRAEEYRPVAAVLLGHLYLMDDEGHAFKRATPKEAASLVVITGIDREVYRVHKPKTQRRIQRALKMLALYRAREGRGDARPALSEINIDQQDELTFFLRENSVALRFGRELNERKLSELDHVWAALGPRQARAQAIYLDHQVNHKRVVVRMAGDE